MSSKQNGIIAGSEKMKRQTERTSEKYEVITIFILLISVWIIFSLGYVVSVLVHCYACTVVQQMGWFHFSCMTTREKFHVTKYCNAFVYGRILLIWVFYCFCDCCVFSSNQSVGWWWECPCDMVKRAFCKWVYHDWMHLSCRQFQCLCSIYQVSMLIFVVVVVHDSILNIEFYTEYRIQDNWIIGSLSTTTDDGSIEIVTSKAMCMSQSECFSWAIVLTKPSAIKSLKQQNFVLLVQQLCVNKHASASVCRRRRRIIRMWIRRRRKQKCPPRLSLQILIKLITVNPSFIEMELKKLNGYE